MAEPWWRFYCETISDRKFKYISKVCGLSKLELIGAWAVICTMGHESPRYGALLVTLQSRVTVTDLADELEISEEITQKMLTAMVDKGMIFQEEDGTFFVQNLQKRQYKDFKAAQRQQKHRDALHETLRVTLPVTPPETETETDILRDKSRPKKSRGDERTKHPAIQLIHSVTGKYPSKDVYDYLITNLGDAPDGAKFKSVWDAWRAHDYKPTNYEGMIAWYRNGIPASFQPPAKPGRRLPLPTTVVNSEPDYAGI